MAKPAATANQAKASFRVWLAEQPKPATNTFTKLKQLFEEDEQADLRWWYQVGRCVVALYPKAEKRQYGNRLIYSLAASLPGGPSTSRENLLYRARKLATEYRKADVAALAKLIDNRTTGFTMRHVIFLLAVGDKQDRQRWQRCCLKQGWDAERLRQEIQKERGYRRSAGGRQAEPPPAGQALPVVLRDVANLCRRWNAFHSLWREEKSFSLRTLPVGEQGMALQKELERALPLVAEAHQAVEELQEKLENTVQQLDRLTKRQRQASSKPAVKKPGSSK